jgi:hypothetical protein
VPPSLFYRAVPSFSTPRTGSTPLLKVSTRDLTSSSAVIISLFPSLLVTSPHHSLVIVVRSLLLVIGHFKLLVICSTHFPFKCFRLPTRSWRNLLESAFYPSNWRQHGVPLFLNLTARARCVDQSDPLRIWGGVLHSRVWKTKILS